MGRFGADHLLREEEGEGGCYAFSWGKKQFSEPMQEQANYKTPTDKVSPMPTAPHPLKKTQIPTNKMCHNNLKTEHLHLQNQTNCFTLV